jgi:hypothetical protein
MNAASQLVGDALAEAVTPGGEIVPTELLAAVLPLDDPIVAMVEIDRGKRFSKPRASNWASSILRARLENSRRTMTDPAWSP